MLKTLKNWIKEYKFDWKFYLISLLIILLVIVGFTVAKRMIDRAQGRDVQRLLATTNLGDIEYSQKQARNYVNRLAAVHQLTPRERKKTEEIFTRAFRERMDIWTEDRLQGRSEAYTRQRQSQSWELYQAEFNQLLETRKP